MIFDIAQFQQPKPINTSVAHSTRRDGTVESAVAREWTLEDARRCKLCSSCCASISDGSKTAVCLKIVRQLVTLDQADLFEDRSEPTRRPRRPARPLTGLRYLHPPGPMDRHR